MSTTASSSQVVKYAGLVTAALAGITLVKTIFTLRDPTLDDESASSSASSCCGGAAARPAYVTSGSDPASNPYETRQSVYEYLLMHFGEHAELVNFPAIQSSQLQGSINFPRECAEICGRYLQQIQQQRSSANGGAAVKLRALDVGCSVGRSSFEMTRFANEVCGLDYSQAFIDAANELQLSGSLPYTMRTEGDLVQNAVAQVSANLDRTRVRFIQGDACDLRASFPVGEKFDVVLAANLLCRLPFPRRFLASLPSLVTPGGYVVMPSPYTWLEQYTPKSEWIGGYVDASGAAVKSFDGLRAQMESEGAFTLVESFDLPFFIRETARKNQWSVSHVTVWKRSEEKA